MFQTFIFYTLQTKEDLRLHVRGITLVSMTSIYELMNNPPPPPGISGKAHKKKCTLESKAVRPAGQPL